jgi:large subunit ribosomal protein L17e
MIKIYSKTLFIGNLAPKVNDAVLHTKFGEFGNVINLKYLAERNFAFLTFETREQAERAKSQSHKMMLEGRPMKIGWAKGKDVEKDNFDSETGESYVPAGSIVNPDSEYPKDAGFIEGPPRNPGRGGFGHNRGGFKNNFYNNMNSRPHRDSNPSRNEIPTYQSSSYNSKEYGTKKFAREPANPDKAVKSCGNDIRAHFKNTYNTARALKGMTVKAAQKYLNQVLEHQRCIPYRRYAGATGRTAQATEWGVTKGRWPTKSVKVVLNLLANLEANAKVKGLETDKLNLTHIQVNRAPRGRRRTYRAHGRITPFLSSPCHIELFATQKDEGVAKEGAKVGATYTRQIRRVAAASRFRRRVVAGGDKATTSK